jgi:hypothetical protein
VTSTGHGPAASGWRPGAAAPGAMGQCGTAGRAARRRDPARVGRARMPTRLGCGGSGRRGPASPGTAECRRGRAPQRRKIKAPASRATRFAQAAGEGAARWAPREPRRRRRKGEARQALARAGDRRCRTSPASSGDTGVGSAAGPSGPPDHPRAVGGGGGARARRYRGGPGPAAERRVHARPGAVTGIGRDVPQPATGARPRLFASMSASWSSTQSPGSRAVTIRFSPWARQERSSADIVSAR